MSLLKRLGKNLKRGLSKIGPVAQMIPHPIAQGIGQVGGAIASRQAAKASATFPVTGDTTMSIWAGLPAIASQLPRVLPAAGRVAGRVARNPAAQGAGGAVAGSILYDQFGNPVRRRRRARGFSARDVSQARRLVRMAKDFSCPGSRMPRAGRSCKR